MSQRLFFWSLVVGLAGFLFGFDTVVIAGSEELLQELWGTSDFFHGNVVVGAALWGTVIGALFGGLPTDRIGRKQTLLLIGVLYTLSALGSALATNAWSFAAFRFVGGLGVGASTIAAPAYISEIAPAHRRGSLVALYQFNIVFGILIAFVSNYLLSDIAVDAWRYKVGVEAIPAALYTLLVLLVPKSPRWLLLHRNDEAGARVILNRINPSERTEAIIGEVRRERNTTRTRENIFQSKYKFAAFLAFAIAFFNQFSGINALLYYADRIFGLAGLEAEAGQLSSIGLGVTNLVFTIIGMLLIDRMGRRQLILLGSVGYILSLGVVAYCFATGVTGIIIPVALFAFIAAHAVGQGAVIWVFISEIFPNHLRAQGQTLGVGTHWLLATIIPASIPTLFEVIGPAAVFGIFCGMMILQLLWAWFLMPETKGVELEDMGERIGGF